jgi:2-polyprenyl-3-methyl-5-hydroxy-6-metoxy-1,4-benzoquinol methylase
MKSSETPQEYYSCDRSEMLAFITGSPKSVLELGCGEGVFGAELNKRFGCRVVGIDSSESAALIAAKRIDQVHVADINSMDFSVLKENFDLVIANDVLEHLADPWGVVSRIRPHISAGGSFIASIPNMRCYKVLLDLLFKAEWRYVDAGILDRTHLRFFTRKSMQALFDESGYVVEQVSALRPPKIKHFGKWLQYQIYPDLLTVQYAVVAKPCRD